MNSFSSFALLVVAMSAIYFLSDKFVGAFQTAIARKRAHIRFLKEKMKAEDKSLAEFIASLPTKK